MGHCPLAAECNMTNLKASSIQSPSLWGGGGLVDKERKKRKNDINRNDIEVLIDQ